MYEVYNILNNSLKKNNINSKNLSRPGRNIDRIHNCLNYMKMHRTRSYLYKNTSSSIISKCISKAKPLRDFIFSSVDRDHSATAIRTVNFTII